MCRAQNNFALALYFCSYSKTTLSLHFIGAHTKLSKSVTQDNMQIYRIVVVCFIPHIIDLACFVYLIKFYSMAPTMLATEYVIFYNTMLIKYKTKPLSSLNLCSNEYTNQHRAFQIMYKNLIVYTPILATFTHHSSLL